MAVREVNADVIEVTPDNVKLSGKSEENAIEDNEHFADRETRDSVDHCGVVLGENNFKVKRCLNEHNASSHNIQDNCDQCSSKVKSKFNIRKHVESPCECFECDSNNNAETIMSNHMTVHTLLQLVSGKLLCRSIIRQCVRLKFLRHQCDRN